MRQVLYWVFLPIRVLLFAFWVLYAFAGAGVGGMVTGMAIEKLFGMAWYVQGIGILLGVAYGLTWFYLSLDGTVGQVGIWLGGLDI